MADVNFCDHQVGLFQLVEAIDTRDLASFAGERARLHPQFAAPPAQCRDAPATRAVRSGAASSSANGAPPAH
jgi:hypothetical protein